MALTLTNLPLRPGHFTQWETEEKAAVRPVSGSVMAVPFTDNWGPANVAVALDSYDDYVDVYGSDLTAGERAVRDGFRGEDLDNGDISVLGAGQIIAVRMGATSGGGQLAQASLTLNNTGAAAAITLRGLYPGTRGNRLRAAVEAGATAGTNDLVILDGAVEKERYNHPVADIAELVASVNARSPYVTAEMLIDNVALAAAAAASLTGGADGATLSSSNWLAALSTLEPERFTILAPYDLTDDSTQASLVAWAQGRNEVGKRVALLLGGTDDEAPAAAVAAAQAINDGNIMRLGSFVYKDDVYGDTSPSALVPRIAGIVAQRGDRAGLSFARLAGGVLLEGPNDAAVDAMIRGGVMTLGSDYRPDAPAHIAKGLTTFSDQSDSNVYRVYRQPKYVRTMHLLEHDFTEALQDDNLGRVTLDADGRELGRIITELADLMREREGRGAFLPGWTIQRDPEFPTSETDEVVALRYGVQFAPPLEQILSTLVIR